MLRVVFTCLYMLFFSKFSLMISKFAGIFFHSLNLQKFIEMVQPDVSQRVPEKGKNKQTNKTREPGTRYKRTIGKLGRPGFADPKASPVYFRCKIPTGVLWGRFIGHIPNLYHLPGVFYIIFFLMIGKSAFLDVGMACAKSYADLLRLNNVLFGGTTLDRVQQICGVFEV